MEEPRQEMKSREAGFELMRIVCMFLIVTSHSIYHSGLLSVVEPFSANHILIKLVRCLCRVSVPGFVMVSGYFMCEKEFHLKKLVLLVTQTLFYSLAIYGLLWALGYETFAADRFLRALFPFLSRSYWFVTSYGILLLFTPILNAAISSMNRKRHFSAVLALAAVYTVAAILMQWASDFSQVNAGSSTAYFILLYLLAAYMRKYTSVPSGRAGGKYALGYGGIAAGMTGLTLLLTWLGEGITYDRFDPDIFNNMNSAFTLLAAICFFQFFRGLSLRGRNFSALVRRIGGLVFAVYLIHDNPFFRKVLWREWTHIPAYRNQAMLWPYMLACVLCVFLSGIAAEFVRKTAGDALGIRGAIVRLCDRAERAVSKKLDQKLR